MPFHVLYSLITSQCKAESAPNQTKRDAQDLFLLYSGSFSSILPTWRKDAQSAHSIEIVPAITSFPQPEHRNQWIRFPNGLPGPPWV